MGRFTALAVLVTALGCAGREGSPRARSVARFDLAARWGTAPFPSELARDATGRVRPEALPPIPGDRPAARTIPEALATRRGFCVHCNIYFPIEGSLDPTSAAAGAVLLDVDPASPGRGDRIPLRSEWNAAGGWLAVRPARGHALRGGGRYVAALTTRLRDAQGGAVGPDPDFLRARDAGRFEAALQALAGAGVPRSEVVVATEFRTADVTADVLAARAAVYAAARPEAVVDRVWPSPAGSLEDLLGVVSERRPGRDVPARAGTGGRFAVVHETVRWAVAGRFRAPRLVTGEGSALGTALRDGTGAVHAGALQDVHFLLLVPRGVDLARLPVVFVHPGGSETRDVAALFADTAGRAGAAVLAIDAFQHGARAASARDERHALRDLAGPDGLAEHDGLDVIRRLFALGGTEPAQRASPAVLAGTLLQLVGDIFATVRFLREGELAALRAADAGLATLGFDPSRTMFLGVATGATAGTVALAAESGVAAAVLALHPGSVAELFAESGYFRPRVEAELLPALGVEGGFDERTRKLVFDPVFDLYRWVLDPVEPVSLARHLVRDPVVPGPRPDLLLQLAGHDEVAPPPSLQGLVAAAGLDGVGVFSFASVRPGAAPLRANLTTPRGAITAAAWSYPGAMHAMAYLAREHSDFVEPLEPPLARRPAPLPMDNPIVAVHAQIETFLRTRIEGGRAEIRDGAAR